LPLKTSCWLVVGLLHHRQLSILLLLAAVAVVFLTVAAAVLVDIELVLDLQLLVVLL
jgi:hypothetical protein